MHADFQAWRRPNAPNCEMQVGCLPLYEICRHNGLIIAAGFLVRLYLIEGDSENRGLVRVSLRHMLARAQWASQLSTRLSAGKELI